MNSSAVDLLSIPQDVLVYVLSFIDDQLDLIRSVSRVCRLLRDASRDPRLWRVLNLKLRSSQRHRKIVMGILSQPWLQNCVQTLSVSCSELKDPADWAILERHSHSLTELDLSGSYVLPSQICQSILSLPKLKKLDLSNTNVGYTCDLSPLSALQNIQSLSLGPVETRNGYTKIHPLLSALSNLNSSPNSNQDSNSNSKALTEFSLFWTESSASHSESSFLHHLSEHSSLRRLSVSLPDSHSVRRRYDADSLSFCSRLTLLTHLDLTGCQFHSFTERHVSILHRLTSLVTLRLAVEFSPASPAAPNETAHPPLRRLRDVTLLIESEEFPADGSWVMMVEMNLQLNLHGSLHDGHVPSPSSLSAPFISFWRSFSHLISSSSSLSLATADFCHVAAALHHLHRIPSLSDLKIDGLALSHHQNLRSFLSSVPHLAPLKSLSFWMAAYGPVPVSLLEHLRGVQQVVMSFVDPSVLKETRSLAANLGLGNIQCSLVQFA